GAFEEISIGANLTLAAGTLSATGGGGTPGGSPQQIQFNNTGSFGGTSVLTFDGTAITQQTKTKFNLVDSADTTKKLQLNLQSISTGTTRQLAVPDADSVTIASATSP